MIPQFVVYFILIIYLFCMYIKMYNFLFDFDCFNLKLKCDFIYLNCVECFGIGLSLEDSAISWSPLYFFGVLQTWREILILKFEFKFMFLISLESLFIVDTFSKKKFEILLS